MGDGHSGRTALTGDEPQYKVVGRFEVVRSAGRFLHDQRYNQYHGKDGKFASKNGSGAGGYVPGKWSAGGREDVINVATATVIENMPQQLAPRPPGTEAYVRKSLEQNLPPSAWILKNGPHAIFGDKGKPDPKVAAEVDHLQKVAPTHGPIRVFVDSHMEPGVLGETDNFSGNIRLSSATRYRKNPGGMDNGWSMPMIETHTERQYTLYHEWGHRHAAEMWRDKPVSVQRPSIERLMDAQIAHYGSLSQYGRSNQYEAYAEAFAEWHLSEGKTTNKAAIGYAKEFGWAGANDQRYNKFHGKDGKFASKNGTGGYVPGQWKGGGREAALDAAVEGAMPQARAHLPGMPDSVVRRWARDQLAPGIPEGSWVLQNGPHVIFGDKGRPDKRMATQVDHLQKVAPTKGKIQILIDSTEMGDVLGETDMGTGNIRINAKTRYALKHKGIDNGWTMPASATHTEREYTLTHEWGHRVNADMYKGKTEAQQLAVEKKLIAVGEPHMDALSEYGKSNQHEAFAEAFAEWHLTGGKTTNEAAVAYAKEFGWRAE